MSILWTKRFDWTDERIARLAVMTLTGFSASYIAKEMGGESLSRNAVIGKQHRLNLGRGNKANTYGAEKPKRPKRPRRTRKASRTDQATQMGVNRHTAAKRKLRAKIMAGDTDLQFHGDDIRDLPPDQSPFAVSLFDAREDQCRWPMNDPGPGFLFCGADTLNDNCSWCARHARLAFAPSRERREEDIPFIPQRGMRV